METTHIEAQLKKVLDEGADSVILYRMPFSDEKIAHVGKASKINEINDFNLEGTGFIIHPFNTLNTDSISVSQQLKYAYKNQLTEELSQQLITVFKSHLGIYGIKETSFNEYEVQFRQMHQTITDGALDKVILSRIKKVDSFDVNNVIAVFDELCVLYSHAFVYALVSPQSGVWIGAGPELLLKKSSQLLNTVSLAGTLPNKAEFQWSPKEEVEQSLVTDYMKDVLIGNGISDYELEGPYSMEAGQVKHLRTDFNFSIDHLKTTVGELLLHLHPTPAVCGMPKARAVKVISDVEEHKREYYAGFLGPVNGHDFSFYVNIRCLKLTQSHAALYLGGGLTAGSTLNIEWEETELKAQTLLSVLKNVANLQGYE